MCYRFIMKALTIKPPWAWAIVHAGKDIENRSWNTNVRGTIAVHASKTVSRSEYERGVRALRILAPRAKAPLYETIVRGAIVGLVDVVGEQHTKSKWHDRDSYGFVLANPRALKAPIPCTGRLRFWEVPAPVKAGISRQQR